MWESTPTASLTTTSSLAKSEAVNIIDRFAKETHYGSVKFVSQAVTE